MAMATLHSSFDMTYPLVWAGSVTRSDASHVTISSSKYQLNYFGSFSYSNGGLSAGSANGVSNYLPTYPAGSSNDDFITAIYQNMFSRAPDQAGFDYWKDELDSGTPRDSFILTVINGAYSPTGGEEYGALLNNKHDVSRYYAEQSSLNPGEDFDNSINALLS